MNFTKIIYSIIITVIIVNGYICYQSFDKKKVLSNFMLSNVEALASYETKDGVQTKRVETSEEESVETIEEGTLYLITTWTQEETICEGTGSIECEPGFKVSDMESHLVEVEYKQSLAE
mgnify:CR=1 FL=1